MSFWQKQPSSRILVSQGTAISTAQANTSGSVANAFSAQTRQVRVVSTLPVWFRIGDGVQTAVANTDALLPSNVVDYFTVNPGQSCAFLSTSTTTGYFSLVEMG